MFGLLPPRTPRSPLAALKVPHPPLQGYLAHTLKPDSLRLITIISYDLLSRCAPEWGCQLSVKARPAERPFPHMPVPRPDSCPLGLPRGQEVEHGKGMRVAICPGCPTAPYRIPYHEGLVTRSPLAPRSGAASGELPAPSSSSRTRPAGCRGHKLETESLATQAQTAPCGASRWPWGWG